VTNFFPVKIGFSKYQTIKALSTDPNVTRINDRLQNWSKPDYLVNDSIWECFISLNLKQVNWFPDADSIKGKIWLSDDVVYAFSIRAYYSKNSANIASNAYNKLEVTLQKDYPFKFPFVQTNLELKMQTAESFLFFKSLKDRKSLKPEFIGINFGFDPYYYWDRNLQKEVYSGVIDYYFVELESYNLKNTKEIINLDNQKE